MKLELQFPRLNICDIYIIILESTQCSKVCRGRVDNTFVFIPF